MNLGESTWRSRWLMALVCVCAAPLGVGERRSWAAASPATPAAEAQAEPSAPTDHWPKAAIQAGISGLAPTVEGEVRLSFGLFAGVGVHGGAIAPLGATARLGYDLAISRRWHLRAGLRLYPFAESTTSWSCDPCTFLVPEVGARFEAANGFVFEFSEPLATVNLTRASADGWTDATRVDNENALLFSALVGYAHQF